MFGRLTGHFLLSILKTLRGVLCKLERTCMILSIQFFLFSGIYIFLSILRGLFDILEDRKIDRLSI